MTDYGNKLLEAFTLSKRVQMNSIETILYGNPDSGILTTDLEIDGFGEQPKQIPIAFENPSGIKKVVVYNTLTRHRYQLITFVVTTPHIEVVDPSGEFIQAQVNMLILFKYIANFYLLSTVPEILSEFKSWIYFSSTQFWILRVERCAYPPMFLS